MRLGSFADRVAPAVHPAYRRIAFPLAQRFLRPASVAAWRALRESAAAPPDRLREAQDDRLRRLARWAYDTVPAYRRRFDEAGVHRGQIAGAADLERLPILTRRNVQELGVDLWSTAISPKRQWTLITSGSTGQPLRAVRDAAQRNLGQATWWHALECCGLHPADPFVDLLNSTNAWKSRRRRRFDALVGALPIPADVLSRRDAAAIRNVLRGWRPAWIDGSPHRIAALARMTLAGELRFDAPLAAICYHGSVLTETSRATITRAFGAPIHTRYGAVEFIPYIAYTCEFGGLHVNAHDFVVEVVEGARREPSGRRAASGRLLVTDLRNFAAPKLRYEVGDLAAWGPAGVCPCGRSWPRLASILGRDSEVVVTPSGREILVTALSWGGMFRAVPEMPDLVWDYQFREHAPGDIEVCVVPTPAFSADHASRIAAGLGAYAGQEIRFRVTTVSAIPAAGLGEKPRLLVRNDTAHSQP